MQQATTGERASPAGEHRQRQRERAGAEAPPPREPLNVLLIMIDSLRADMPWAGYPRPIAPRLDTFQRQRCVTYPSAYALSSYTAKSVAPALVGEYPSAMPHTASFFTRYPDEQNLFVSERIRAAGHHTIAGHAHGYFLPALGNNQGFADYRLIKGGVDVKAVTSVTSQPLTELALEQLAQPEPAGKRFFAYFHYLDPHHTYEKHKGHPDFGNSARDLYDNEVHYTDHWVGKLLDFAERQPWWSRTAVIITADHGEGFGERGHYRHAYELWESLVKVPLLVCVPGVKPRIEAVRRSHIDLAPTIADLMLLPAEPPFRGQSLVPEVLGRQPAGKRRIVVDLPRADLMDRRRGVIEVDDYKIVAFGDEASFKLFNLRDDPWEARELGGTEPEALARMKQVYAEESAKIPNLPVVGGGTLKGAPPGRRF